MNRNLLNQLENCDLKVAAFHLAKGLGDGVYKTDMVSALDLFVKLPCPETAFNLIAVCPEILEVISLASSDFIQTIPREYRGPKINDFEEWIESVDFNLQATKKIQVFLLVEATANNIRVGFHKMRDQAPLYQRLAQVGIKKRLFVNRRQFLRDTITENLSAFRAVNDMVCIHGVIDGREKFWNGLGAESNAQLYLNSEVMYEISPLISQKFNNLICEIRK